MRAIRLHAFGPPSHLVLADLPDLVPAPGQVRIAVEYAGVHLLDTTLRRGEPGPMPRPELPTVPGREVAGVVDVLGSRVDPSLLGRRVVAHLGMNPGGYASQALVEADALFEVPDHVDLADAVAIVGTGRTALGILEMEPIRPNDVVLVPAAAGGVGWLLVQAAHAAGASVVALASGPGKLEHLATLTPEVLVDYGEADWPAQVRAALGERQVTVAFDGVGGDVGRVALELLAPGGRMQMFGYSAGTPTRFDQDDVIERSVTVSWGLGPVMAAMPGGIPGLARRALQRLADGAWQPLVTRFDLAEAAAAHTALETRQTVGKVVLRTSASETRSLLSDPHGTMSRDGAHVAADDPTGSSA